MFVTVSSGAETNKHLFWFIVLKYLPKLHILSGVDVRGTMLDLSPSDK